MYFRTYMKHFRRYRQIDASPQTRFIQFIMINGMISISPSSTSLTYVPASPAYGVYISQIIRYARACSTYGQVLVRGSLLTNKLMSQGFQQSRFQAAFLKFYRSLQRSYLPLQHFVGPHAV
jgi:hypothetical protein